MRGMRRIVIALLILCATAAIAEGPGGDILRARELTAWINEHVVYERSPERIKSPADTLATGGDCADLSALLIAALEASGVRRATMLLLDLYDYEEHHAVVELYGRIYDPTTGREYLGAFPLPHRIGDSIGISNLLADWEGP